MKKTERKTTKEGKEYAGLYGSRDKSHLPNTNKYGFDSCGCSICKRTYANIEETNNKIKPSLGYEAALIAREAIDLLVKKHNDYGPKNISDAPGGPLNGLNVRLHDKVARINNLYSNNKEPEYETIKDTFIDILNYALIALLVIDGKWDTTK